MKYQKNNKSFNARRRRTSAPRLTTSASSRRGVLLLVILGMLTLFLMIGTAFIMSGNQYRRANKTYSKVGEQKNLKASQEGFLTEVINQIIRDTANQNSSLRFHSLLRDLYGTEGLVATIPLGPPTPATPLPTWAGDIGGSTNNLTAGQMLEFQIPVANFRDYFGNQLAPERLSQFQNFYNGQVITFLDGPAKGRSTRIVGFYRDPMGADPNAYPAVIRVLNVTLDNALQITDPRVLAGSRILINGRPFNGTGAGYNPDPTLAANAPKSSAAEQIPGMPAQTTLATPIALMPNAPFFNAANLVVNGTANYFHPQWTTLPPVQQQRLFNSLGFDGLGGSDESYDAPDFQNMYLAWTAPNPGESVLPSALPDDITTFTPPNNLGSTVLPSFHRPDLIHYWANISPQFKTTATDPVSKSTLGQVPGVGILRKILLRPNWHDHPDFDGSNPEYAALRGDGQEGTKRLLRMIYGPWDVDNDMDGIRDSVWVDFGAPVMVGSKGRLVKPLAAIMVLDMDGRLNVNAHGTRELAGIGDALEKYPLGVLPGGTAVSTPEQTAWQNIPRGQGFGVAEIDISHVLYQPIPNPDASVPDRFAEPYTTPDELRVVRQELAKRLMRGAFIGDFVNLEDGLDASGALVPGTGAVFFNRVRGRYNSLAMNGDDEPGVDDRFDLSAQLKMQGFPSHFNNTLRVNRSNFGMLPDLRGRYKSALNDFGQFVTTWTPEDSLQHAMDEDNPYEIDLSSTGARGEGTSVDNPFSIAEFERILRAYDLDAGMLPSRLHDLAGGFRLPAEIDSSQQTNTIMLNNWRALLTTDSFDLPEPSFQLPAWVRNGPDNTPNTNDDYAIVMARGVAGVRREPVNATFADLVEYQLLLRIYNPTNTTPIPLPQPLTTQQQTRLNASMRMLIAPEMLAGLKLDLNRPLGNGRDDNNNDVVDEPGELEFNDLNSNGVQDPGEEAHWLIDETRAGITASKPTIDFENAVYGDDVDRNGDGNIEPWERGDTDGDDTLSYPELVNLHNYRRQLLARHLYVLAMAVIDPLPVPAAGTNDPVYLQKLRDRSRQLAQWAMNAVDFRDPDNIMTAFEYTENPFLNGWFVDPVAPTPVVIDGIINPTYQTTEHVQMVWGAEKPEVLMTETLAWHDRWTEDGPGENPDDDEIDSGKKGSTDYEPDRYDRSFDQRQRPRGAAFVELYNPSAPMPGASADTHYIDTNGNDLGINLAAVSGATRTTTENATALPSPVWRLSVYQTRQVRGDQRNIIAGPDKDPDDRDNSNVPSTVDRSIYFAGFDPGYPRSEDGVAFFNRIANPNVPDPTTDNVVPPLRPGRYMVVGAGEEVSGQPGQYLANFGAKSGSRTSPRGIVLRSKRHTDANPADASRTVELVGADGTTIIQDPASFPVQTPPDNVMPPILGDSSASIADVAIIDQPRRFTISEPAGGYPNRWAGSQWNGTEYGPEYIDIPLDDQRTVAAAGGGIGGGGQNGGGIGAPASRKPRTDPLVDGETRLSLPGQAPAGGGIGGGGAGAPADPEQARRIVPGFSWIYLQRLANPLLAWNPLPNLPNGSPNPDFRSDLPVNPYLTVDSMGANVTVFNGLRDYEGLRVNASDDPLEFRNQYALDTFASVQRGRVNAPTDPALRLSDLQARAARTGGRSQQPVDPDPASPPGQPDVNLWNPEGIGITASRIAGYFRNKAGTGTGAEPGANDPSKDHHFNGIPDNTLGFLNEPFRATGAAADPLRARAVPRLPFPSLYFLNRPYANPGELAQVPAWRSSQLLQTFSFLSPTAVSPLPNQELYEDTVAPTARRAAEVKLSDKLKWIVDGPYGHLLNFFRINTNGQDQNPGTADDQGIAGLYRVLDLVSVSSLHVGNETWLNPATFGNTATAVTNSADPRYGLQPPFNKIASRREPGRVNINTIARKEPGTPLRGGKAVWDSLWQGNTKRNGSGDAGAHNGPDDDDFFLARKGYWSTTTGPGVGTKVDENTLLNPAFPTIFANPFRAEGTASLVPIAGMIRTDLDATLNRSFEGTAGITAQSLGEPFCSTNATGPTNVFRDSNRNSFFRHSPISRLSSMTTNRSNVFAIWVTVGFFEVEEVEPWADVSDKARYGNSIDVYNRVYPDGYRFGKEAGIETGEVERIREFAIVDRTIPVAFEPGANHNIGEMIRLRRKIKTD